ncbi:hypothetical protein PYW08_006979 [Mythimna loreyi]|uniref:Uncharacterized protein n=1 Tax=Mythimna loreyi TaxID=667449 RepID=A0ACC2RAT9_9NEOP|nr:hypothetical protein PYW08_006979 [Mythimna loreyi]
MRSRLDALRPDVAQVARAAQQRQVAHAGGTPQPPLRIGDPVLTRDYSTHSNKWSTGTVSKSTGPVSYRIDMGNGVEWRRHRDQVLPVGNKSRYSLSRASIGAKKGGGESIVQDDEAFEDASELSCERETEAGSAAAVSPDAPATRSPPPPPPPGASARTIRAHGRAVKKDKIIAE